LKRLRVNIPKNEYDIIVGKGLLRGIDTLIREVYDRNKVHIITDDNVYSLHVKKAEEELKQKGFDVNTIIIPAGEQNKTIETVSVVWSKLIEGNITRKDLIIAYGGGVVRRFSRLCRKYYFKGSAIYTSANYIAGNARQ